MLLQSRNDYLSIVYVDVRVRALHPFYYLAFVSCLFPSPMSLYTLQSMSSFEVVTLYIPFRKLRMCEYILGCCAFFSNALCNNQDGAL